MKKILLLSTILLLYGCPDRNDCDDFGRIAQVDNLIQWTPVQTQYRQGDVITLTVEIPAVNNYLGSSVNILEQTGNQNALLLLSTDNFQVGNQLTFIKGFQEREVNWFGLTHNPVSGNYELKIEITLNRLGDYNFPTQDRIDFLGRNCNRYFIDTNIEWPTFGQVTFEVIP